LEGEALKAAQAKAYQYLYWGSVILGLGNGTVEAFINPVVATMFNKDKTKWLNILHAGWPGGLVLGGLLTIALGKQAAADWRILIYLIAIPAVVYLVMLVKARFPVNERVSSGTSYKEMLAEFGYVGALIAAYFVFKQLGMVFGWNDNFVYFLTTATAAGYGVYCNSLGRPLLIVMCIIMIPLATTELGTDSAISGLMEEPMKEAGKHPLLVLIYTSAIMMILRFWFAGPIVKKLTPLGLLATSAVLAIVGLYLLSTAKGLGMIFACATLYGFGKTFFWPTMLGVVSEQCPKGGALTLNAIAGIGMLAVGILGGPVIGKLTEDSIKDTIDAKDAEVYKAISKEDKYFLGDYTAVDNGKVATLDKAKQDEIKELVKTGKQSSLARITVFPMFMLACYIGLIFYFKGRGGYKPVELSTDSGNKNMGNDGEAHVSEA
jgi:MFS family permease